MPLGPRSRIARAARRAGIRIGSSEWRAGPGVACHTVTRAPCPGTAPAQSPGSRQSPAPGPPGRAVVGVLQAFIALFYFINSRKL